MEKFLELVKKYQRPVRTIVWTFLISLTYLLCLFTTKPCNDGFVTESILVMMFVDMGVYTVSRTFEKTKKIQDNA